MPEPIASRSEQYLRFSRRSLIVLLLFVLVLGALALAMALRPERGGAWMVQAGWVLPIAIVLSIGMLQRTTLRGVRWDPATPEAQAILQDEWRRTNMDRAIRIALVVVLIAQVPLGFAFAQLPALRAVMAMAAGTTTLGMVTLLAFFLYFDRDVQRGE